MISFIEELWKSIFTPGTSPTLIVATHATFALLVFTLTVFVFLSKSIHLVNLLVLSILLWATLTWFIKEINSEDAKLKSNEALTTEPKETTSNSDVAAKSTGSTKLLSTLSSSSSTSTSTTRKSRKI